MLFNSIDFAVFLPVVFLIYWFLVQRNLSVQNAFLVLASYVFYGWWDPRFLLLLFLSTAIDFGIGLALDKEERTLQRKWILWGGISFNLALLFFFKYYNFFQESFVTAFRFLGMEWNARSLSLILPVGISFYTFQSISYSIDVYRKKIEPTRDAVAFMAYVSFFPQLVAGPIERGSHLLPQFFQKRTFDHYQAVRGMRQILWGLFKKILIADNCAEHVNYIFSDPASQNGSTLLLGALLFSFQIYGDFSGYSDIAIGTARLFGFELMQNFSFPYFSTDIARFWRRWHISLTSWFRDYVYIPLGGSRMGQSKQIRNTLIVFLLSGLWHGAQWTFVVWGCLHFLYMLPGLLSRKDNHSAAGEERAISHPLYFIRSGVSMIITFLLVMLAWVFFRSASIGQAFIYIQGLFSFSLFEWPSLPSMGHAVSTLLFIFLFMCVEWHSRKEHFGWERLLNNKPVWIRWSLYLLVVCWIYFYGNFAETIEFIYFQF